MNENENLRARLTELALCVSTGQLPMEDIARKLCELAELPEDCEDLVSHIRNPEKTCDTCARYKPDLASASKSWATCSEKHEVGKDNCPDYASRYLTFPLTVRELVLTHMDIPADGKKAELVKVRLAGESEKTHLGFLLHDIGSDLYANYCKETEVLRIVQYSTPPIFVPALGRIVYGAESWWAHIQSEADFADITDGDIENQWYCAGWNGLLGLLEKAPTVDAVPVVRCEGCVFSQSDGWVCGGTSLMPQHRTFPNSFCSDGERKNKNDKETNDRQD